MFRAIEEAARQAVKELLAAAKMAPGAVMVVSCSSSEVLGQRIGKGSSQKAAQAVYQGIAPVLLDQGIVLAAKISQDVSGKTHRFVPIQDFSKPWTDTELYEKYGLTQNEIDFIEATIKPVE